MNTIALIDAARVDQIASPENDQADRGSLNLNSPALAVFTDFSVQEALVVEGETPILEAEAMMKHSHVRLKLVINRDQTFLGVLALEDIQEAELIKKVAEGYSRQELKVADLMRKRSELDMLDYDDLRRMTIGDLLTSLQDYQRQHCLVVDRDKGQIRGLVSASDIVRKLRIPRCIQKSPKFADLHIKPAMAVGS